GTGVGDGGGGAAEDVVVGKGIAEEVGALGAAGDRLLFRGVAHEGGDAGQVGVDSVADGDGFGFEGPVVVVDPVAGLLGVEEGEGEGADAALGGEVDGLPSGARHPYRRVGLLVGLGHDVARGHGDVRTGVAGEGGLG